jgi:hypothetical protein
MLFMQPVVVNDVEQSTVAEVREVQMTEPRAAEPAWTDWSGVMLAQSSLDQRSPFGANAVDNNNKVTPGAATTEPATPAPSNNPDVPGSTQEPSPSSAPPAPAQPDTTAPGTGTTTAPPAAAPGTATPSSTPGATGGTTGTMPAPGSTPAAPGNIDQPSSSTFPGASQPSSATNPGVLPGGSSGASNSR